MLLELLDLDGDLGTALLETFHLCLHGSERLLCRRGCRVFRQLGPTVLELRDAKIGRLQREQRSEVHVAQPPTTVVCAQVGTPLSQSYTM